MAVGPKEWLSAAAFAVTLVPQSPFLLAVQRIVRGVHVQDYILGRLCLRFEEPLDNPSIPAGSATIFLYCPCRPSAGVNSSLGFAPSPPRSKTPRAVSSCKMPGVPCGWRLCSDSQATTRKQSSSLGITFGPSPKAAYARRAATRI